MQKPILVLQFRTDKSLKHERDCLISASKLPLERFHFVNILDKNVSIPRKEDLSNYQAVIVAASGQFNVTDWPSNVRRPIEKLKPFFDEMIKQDFPTLAICFGHQLIAKFFGGEVTRDSHQAEAGTVEITLNNEGKSAKIFTGIPEKFWVSSGHKDSVTKVPNTAVILASSQKTRVAAYQIGQNIYCLQFHPEFDLDSLIWRLSLYPEYIVGKTLEDIRKSYHEIPFATQILKNFKNLYL